MKQVEKLRSQTSSYTAAGENKVAKENQASFCEFDIIFKVMTDRFETLKWLNDKILGQTDVTEIEEEIVQAEEYTLDLEITLGKLKEFRQLSEVTERVEETQNRTEIIPSREEISPPNITEDQHTTGDISQTVSIVSSNSSQYHRLPKLTLPKFSGDILTWKTCWDSFESTVHLNAGLNDVQKFSYLKSQLENEAARTIEGFALTNANYSRAVELLKERYGQGHKSIHALMQALLQLPAPVYSVHSLRQFYDNMESYIHSLESMGQFQEAYGCLLVPVVLDKLPSEIRKHLAREHSDSNWRLADLRLALKKDLSILEAGISTRHP